MLFGIFFVHEIDFASLLDDEELEFLGAPWGAYEAAAKSAGINVIRYPIGEGHAPTDMDDFEEKVLKPISALTLAGQNVLCHCRGGESFVTMCDQVYELTVL